MIITKNIEKKVTQYNLRIFKKFGFSIGDIATVPIVDWDRNSHEKVLAKCDICSVEKILPYREYMNSFEKYNLYTCSTKCSKFKNRITCLNKYGVENYNNREKYKKTCLNRYGVDNIFKNSETIINIDYSKRVKYGDNFELIVDKTRLTIFDRYGVDNISKLESIKQTKKETYFNNYGFYYPMQNENVRRKSRLTCLEKYGAEYPIQNSYIKIKREKTCLEKYGVKHYVMSDDWLYKISLKYNNIKSPADLLSSWLNSDDYINRREEIYSKIKKTNTERLNWFKPNSNEYLNYRKMVDLLTKSNKKILLDNWNGYDYYDKQYIKNNFNLYYNDALYPTIDHKISVKNGFLLELSIDEISSIDNLCITKRSINSKKNSKSENDFTLNNI